MLSTRRSTGATRGSARHSPMPEDVFTLFDDYAARFARGEAPDLRGYLTRAGEGAGELGRLVDAFLARASPPEPDEARHAAGRGRRRARAAARPRSDEAREGEALLPRTGVGPAGAARRRPARVGGAGGDAEGAGGGSHCVAAAAARATGGGVPA